jgi:hypothetical protein
MAIISTKDKRKELTEEEINEVFDEYEVYFNWHINVDTGEVLTEKDGAYYDKENVVVDPMRVLTLGFNDKTAEEIMKRTRTLLITRGIKDPEAIDENDNDVRDLVKKYRRAFRNVPQSKISTFIQSVKREHTPHYTLALFQVISWAIMRKSVFTIHKNKSIESKFDVVIPESYWDGAKVERDPLDELLDEYMPPAPLIDKNNPFEVMIAVASQIVNEYKPISDVFQDAVKRVYTGISILNSQEGLDDISFLRDRLDELLS